MRIIISKRKERPNLHGWKQQLEVGLPLETRKQKGRRLAKERQLESGTTKSSRWRTKQIRISDKILNKDANQFRQSHKETA